MIFFDDYTANHGDVTQLGVMGVHNPRGLTSAVPRGDETPRPVAAWIVRGRVATPRVPRG